MTKLAKEVRYDSDERKRTQICPCPKKAQVGVERSQCSRITYSSEVKTKKAADLLAKAKG